MAVGWICTAFALMGLLTYHIWAKYALRELKRQNDAIIRASREQSDAGARQLAVHRLAAARGEPIVPHDADPVGVAAYEQLDQDTFAAASAPALKYIAWCPDECNESEAREYEDLPLHEIAVQHAERLYYQDGLQLECYEIRVRATKGDLVREWDVTVDVGLITSFSAGFVSPRKARKPEGTGTVTPSKTKPEVSSETKEHGK